jgi:hypothetical protein
LLHDEVQKNGQPNKGGPGDQNSVHGCIVIAVGRSGMALSRLRPAELVEPIPCEDFGRRDPHHLSVLPLRHGSPKSRMC